VWGELRAAQLEREPFCRECAKVAKQTPATEVDHVIPLADGGSFDDPSNHQSLCFRHHWQKDRGRERQAHGTEGEEGARACRDRPGYGHADAWAARRPLVERARVMSHTRQQMRCRSMKKHAFPHAGMSLMGK
jgi:hypothetical protein